MYNNRFQSQRSRRLLHIDGKMSLVHLGSGNFIYTLPGKHKTYVGKIELGRKKYRLPGAGIAVAVLFIAGIVLFSNMEPTEASVKADNYTGSASESIEFEEKTEAWKNQIIASNTGYAGSSTSARDESVPEVNGGIRIHEYTIKKGDTLASVARSFKVGADLIAASSGLKAGEAVRIGQTLQIPSKPGLIYTVRSGDSLAAIALKYSTTADKIRQENPDLRDFDLIDPGSIVFLPDARIPKPPNIWSRPAAGRITSPFGWRRHPVFGYRQLHTGTDIGIYYSPVKAARNGEVTFASRLGGYGNAVIIRHDNQFQTLYGHLSRISVKPGQIVKAGAPIAISGNTGMSTGPHLHFEVIQNGKAINPARFVKF